MDPAYKQKWYYDEQSGEIRDSDTEAPIDFFDDVKSGRLAAAAPKLARALANIYGEASGVSLSTGRAVREALREADVPLDYDPTVD